MTRALSIQPFDLSNGTISVLSIDFFDTLVTRNVAQPTHVFAAMEKFFLKKDNDTATASRAFALKQSEMLESIKKQ